MWFHSVEQIYSDGRKHLLTCVCPVDILNQLNYIKTVQNF